MIMNLSIPILILIIAIISTCISIALAADIQSNTNVILNHILTTNSNDNNYGTAIAQQQLSCNNETTIQIYGMYPNKGSELGNTPVALAVQIDSNNNNDANNDDDIREKLNCNFGSTIQPLINGDDMNDQLDRIAFATSDNSSYANNNSTELGSNYELLLCKSPPASSIGHIPFHISCNQEEEHQTLSSISALQFEYTIATSVHTIHPPLGTPNYTTVTIFGSGYSSRTYLSCFFGRDHIVSATYISSEEVQCNVPSSLPLSEEGEGKEEYPIFISNNGIDYEGDELWSTVSFVTVPLPIVHSVGSNTITWSSNVNVNVIGLYFNPHASSSAVCLFDFGDNVLTSVGIVVNDAQINCPLPTLQEDELAKNPFIGNIRVSSNGGTDYSTTYSSIFIYGPLLLQSVHPNSALESGGTDIILYGSNFHPAETLSCLFTLINDYVITIPATYYSLSKVECQTPQAMMAGVAQLSVSTSNQDMSNSLDFAFRSLPTLISATSLTSSSWSSGTIVTIQGSGFNTDEDVDSVGSSTYCQFGNALVMANALNSTALTCITPPVTAVWQDVSSSYEALDSLAVSLEVSINGYSTTNSGITFQYHSDDSMDDPLSIDDEDEVDTHQINPATVQVTSFSPTFGSEQGGTIIHLVGTGFDNEELSSPHCVFYGGETTIATVISHTLIKCIVPSAEVGQDSTSVGLRFNGDNDLVLADTVFSYIRSPIITNISPKYISSSGGSKLAILGRNFTPDEHLVGVWKCSFRGTVVAASVTSDGDIVCFAPPIQPGVVNVRVSINGVDFTTQSVKVISHLPSEIHHYTFQDETVVVNGINFQPSPDLSCIFNVSSQDVRVTSATWESDTHVTCSIPPIVAGATSTTLEISNTNEHHPNNPNVSFHFPQFDESLSSATLDQELIKESKAENLATEYSISIDYVEPTAVSEVGGDELTIHIVSDLQISADLSCAFKDSAGETKTSHVTAVITKYNAKDGKRSILVTCPTPEMMPGEYTLSLDGISEDMAQNITTTITVYPELSVLEEMPQTFDISSSDNNTDIRQLDELDTLLSINIHPSFGPESGGNTVIINGSGFKANSTMACQFGEDSITDAKFVSDESLECIAPPVINHPVVDVSVTIDGVEWTSSSSYSYLPMLRINEISPSSMQIDVPHRIIISSDNFEYMPSHLMCKLGTTMVSNVTRVDETSVSCFIPPVYQPGEVTLDIVTEDGTSMLEPNSTNTIKFHTPIDYSIFPSFADVTGGTNVIITKNNFLEEAPKLVTCRFNLNNNTSIDVVATQLSETRHSCLTPNVYDWSTDHPIYATLSLVSEESHTSIPFMFKTTPIIESINPSIGSVNGNTLVRVRSSSSMWVNSTLLTCLFGEQEVRAIFVSARIIDCVSSPGRGSVAVKVSDNNNINLPQSSQIYTYNEDPFVSSVTPDFGLASDDNVITLIGSGFANRMESSCMFQDGSSGSTYQAKGSFINETAMECYVGPEVLPPSQYVCRASNNGSIEYGGFNATTHCVLLDQDELRISSSLAEDQSEESVRCPAHCPSLVNAKTKYTLGISLGDSDQVYSTSSFWCEPRTRILDVLPKYISVEESTLISINLEEFRPSSTLHCVFGGGREMMPATYTAKGVVECPSPVINHPKRMTLSLSADNLNITEEVEINVVDPISISRIDPKILFGGTDVIIEGNNFMPDKMICTFEGIIGEVAMSDDTHIVCRSPIDLVSTSAEVILSIDGAPQLNTSAGYVDVLPPPRVDKITPSSSLALGGANVIIYGANFYDISNPVCYFSDAIVKAYVLTETTMSCKTPERNDVGEVSVQVSLDDRSIHSGDISFSFLSPITLQDVYPQVVINGTRIRLVGEGFTNAPLQCAFGDSTTPATVLSSTEATCIFTSNNEDFGQMQVSIISLDSIPLSISNVVVRYHPRVEIYSSSRHGTVMGGELVELQVYGILDDIITEEEGLGLVHCQFGDKFTLATLELDELIVSCSTPAADSPGNVSLSLTYSGLPFSSNNLTFEYTTQPKVESVHPTSGALSGGTSVRIQGLNLQSISSCKFGNELAYGYMDNENTIVCISPATSSASRHAISLLLDPSREWLDTGIDFHYIEPFTYESVYPLSIDRGVDFIRVTGRGYSRSADLQCCFGRESNCILSEATVLSNTTLKCPLPPWEVIQNIGPTFPVAVTSNSIDFVHSPTSLTYEDDDMIVVKKLYPLVGPSFGGTVVDVFGLGFQERASYSCWFGKVSSRAEYISDGHIQCITPTSFVKESEQVVVVDVSVTLSSLTPHPLNSSLNFTFYSQPTRLEMYPTHYGVSTGDTEMRIGQLAPLLPKLQSLGTSLDPTCQFDTTVVSASNIDYKGGYITCTSPPIEAADILNVTTHAVQVSVSLNGRDYISTFEHYHYYQPISIHSVNPDIVWVDEEATELIIRGSNFLPLNQASCIVGEELIQADVVSSSEVRCLVQNLNPDQVVPVSVSLNGVDSSNVLPLSCRVNTPMLLSASPLFVSEAGGTTVQLQGAGFDQIKSSGLVKLNDALVPLSVIDNNTASFDAPSGRGGDHVIQISYYGSTFTETGFELQYLPPLHISVVKPAFVVLDTVNRVTISGSFGGDWNYKCVLTFDDNDSILEFTPSYVNETSMSCDTDLFGASAHHSSNGHLAVYREEDNQTSNSLNIYTTPRYAIESVDPSVLSESQANAGVQLLAIQALQEMVVTAEPILCKFTDSIGIITTTSVDIITSHELRCTISPLTGDSQVCLTREDGTVQSNSIELSVHPTSQLVKLIPSSGPLSGGTNVTVQGIGFSAYSDVDILCQFGNEISAAHFVNDTTAHCKSPSSSRDDNNVTFSLVQSSRYGNIPISNTDLSFQYYSSLKIVTITPDNGPASGGHKISLHIEDLGSIGSSFTLSFTSVDDQSHVTCTKDVKVLNESTLQLMTPPSPTGCDGGMVVINVSGNGQDYWTDGVYYNYTESSMLRSFYPSEVVEGSCFNLTILVENLYTSPSHCVIGGGNFTASNGEVAGTVTCNNVCLDVHEGPYSVGLILDNNIFLPASNDIQVRHRINAKEMTPFMGSTEGGTRLIIRGEFQDWSSKLYCFFGEYLTLATIINDTAIQCSTPSISMLEEDLLEFDDNLLGVNVHIAPSYHHQSTKRGDITSSMVFNYYEKEVIESVKPRSGSEEGGTAIQVYGSGFINTTSLTCKFGEEVESQAVFLNNEHIMCTSPPLSDVVASQVLPMSVPLLLSNNNKDYVSAGTYVYHATPQIARLSPSIGPAQTSVRLHMKSSLGWVEHLVCRFGGILAAYATVLSDHEVECISPNHQHLGETPSVEVEISLNSIDFFTSGHSFQYTNQPVIYSMSPEYGPISGGNIIVLHGKSMVFSQDNLLCHFGESRTMAVSVSESKITCLVPASTKHGIVPFTIVSEDTDTILGHYHDDMLTQYKYLPPLKVSSLHPSFGSMGGGTLLSITVEEEVPKDELYCVFESSTTTVAIVDRSNRSLVCLTPQSNTSGGISIGLAQDQDTTMLTTSNVQFRYTPDPTITGLYPRRGSRNSKTNITLKGSSLLQGDIDSVVCKIGSHELPATFLSDEEVKCTAPPDIPIREIQAVTVIGSSKEESSSTRSSFTLGFKGVVSDPIIIDSSADEMRERLFLDLPGLEDISVSMDDESSLDKTFLVTFLGMVKDHQPLFTVEHTTVDVHIDRRQSLCCNVSLSLNGGVDFYDTDLVFVYHDKVVVTDISPDHGSTNGGTDVELSMLGISSSSSSSSSSSQEDALCIFGSVEVQGTWTNEQTISCVSPASLDDATVAVGVKFSESGVRAESMVQFKYHFEPDVLSIFPLSLPALHASTTPIDVYGNHFYESESMTCVFDISIPLEGGGVSSEDRLATYRQLATFHNSNHIQCPNPPILQSFFSITDQSWASNSILVEGSKLSISLESGSDSYYIGAMPFHALVETSSLFPESGPRKGGSEVLVEGINIMNTTHLTCRFGSVVGPLAQYISPTKVLCITPHYPDGYGRVVVPIQVALNGIDFSSTSEGVMFEYHEPIVLKDVDPMASLPMGGSIINVALDDESMGLGAVRERSPDMILVSHLDPPYGPRSGGNVVTIQGHGFTANHATTCSFGGVTITASFVSEESLSCVAPRAVDDNMLVDVVISVDGDNLIGGPHRYMHLPIKL